MAATWYPVVDERALRRVAGRFMPRRDVAELPVQVAGTVLVFEVGGRHEVFEERRHLTGKETAVVEAVSVSLVDTRPRGVEVAFLVPSQSPADEFRISATFRCHVTQPEAVVRDGLLDIRGPLQSHLRQDREMVALGASFEIDEINNAREELSARVRAYQTLHPLRVRGMDIRLTTVGVDTPTPLRGHAAALRDARWTQIRNELAANYEMKTAETLADLIAQGPDKLEALAIARGEQTAALAAQRGYERESEQQQRIVELLTVLQKDGHLDRLRVDADPLVQNLTDSFHLPRRSSGRQVGGGGRDGAPRRIEAGESPEPDDDLILDEDELDND